METSLVFQEHPDDYIWEEYSFGRLNEAQESAAEEHLLLCEPCRLKVAQTDDWRKLFKHWEPWLTQRVPKKRVLMFPAQARAGSVTLAAAVVAAGVAAVIWFSPGKHEAIGTPVAVSLRSLRGGTTDEANRAPARRPLALSISAPGVICEATCRVEIVTVNGSRVWSGPSTPSDGALSAYISTSLQPGAYWVRLYGPNSALVAEYGLKLE